MAVSVRSHHLVKELSLMRKFILECNKDEFNLLTNPNGIINLGTATNGITRDILENKLSDISTFNYREDDGFVNYYEDHGIPRLQKAASAFVNEFFRPSTPVIPDNFMFGTGAMSCMDVLCHLIGDPGDLILSPTPIYPITALTIKNRAQLRLWPLPLTNKDNFNLTVEKLENVYNEAIKNGKVCGVLLTNPGNPIGNIFSSKTLREILDFCTSKNIHLLMDETYANCIHDENAKFESILSCPKAAEMDNVHVIYGFSKDFGLTSFRVGMIHTTNQNIITAYKSLSPYQAIPKPIMNTMSKILEDADFVRYLLQQNRQRLSKAYRFTSDHLKGIKVDHLETPAGVFLWMNLSRFCRPITSTETEMRLFQKLFKEEKLYIVPGSQFLGDEPGWFRLTFSKPTQDLEKGLNRLEAGLNSC